MKEALYGNQVKNGCVQMDVLHGESEPITPGPIQLTMYVVADLIFPHMICLSVND